MYICLFFDPATKKCKLWDTYQSDYSISTYCCTNYPDSCRKCPNFREKMY